MKADNPKLTGTTIFELTAEQPALEMRKMLLTSKEIEQIFRVSRTSVWRHAKNGVFRKIKIGQRIYFDADEIKRIIRP